MSNFSYSEQLQPFRSWKSVTPDDNNDLDSVPRGLIATGAGDIAIQDGNGNNITITVSAYEVLDFSPVRVLSTGTTATGIYALY